MSEPKSKLDEMIEFVRESDSNGWRSDAVIAALRAGQAMRDADDKVTFCEAMVEWDDATKGDDE